MIINLHAGHGLGNGLGCGAVGLLNESDEARKVVIPLISMLEQYGHTVYDNTQNISASASTILNNIITECNSRPEVDLNISIHFNAFGDNANGTEAWIYSEKSQAFNFAHAVVNELAWEFGFTNRGVKISTNLGFLSKTVAPALLIEVCFVDSTTDWAKYMDKEDTKEIRAAKALFKAITGTSYEPIREDNSHMEPDDLTGFDDLDDLDDDYYSDDEDFSDDYEATPPPPETKVYKPIIVAKCTRSLTRAHQLLKQLQYDLPDWNWEIVDTLGYYYLQCDYKKDDTPLYNKLEMLRQMNINDFINAYYIEREVN